MMADEMPEVPKKRRLLDAAPKTHVPTKFGALSEDELGLELRIYYDRLFPTSFLFHWLSTMAPADGLKFREMSFTLPGDIYVRYCSYVTKEALKNDLVSKLPIKIDIGAVYNAPPNMHASIANFAPVHKELVFDIDMTDYDDIRSCCSGAAVCGKCWVLMTAAIKVVHTILTSDFGFEHIMWVFSGRRGVHCWVCDNRARKLSHDQRAAIVDFLSVYMGKEKKLQNMNAVHPSLSRAYEQLLPYFEDLLESQRWMDSAQGVEKIMEYFDSSVRDDFRPKDLDQDGGMDDQGPQRWAAMQAAVRQWLNKNGKKYSAQVNSMRSVLLRIVFGHIYPRLDVNVSKHLNHLLKSPFCVHPKTGKICVPIDPSNAEGFDCDGVPHVKQLHAELNTARELNRDTEGFKPTWRHTSLAPHIEVFKTFVLKLMNASRAENPRSYAKLVATNAEKELATESF